MNNFIRDSLKYYGYGFLNEANRFLHLNLGNTIKIYIVNEFTLTFIFSIQAVINKINLQ